MGERKGTNLYYPPDYDPKKGGINKFQGTHALRERARKLHLGILIIRFEMPYNIWCDGCGNHIGMGVRYNAEKKKIGMYYSTPVYQFRMKCHLCDNHFEIKTDPGNLDYIIVSGARRQENRWDPTQNGQVVPEDKNVQKRLFDDAMFKLEHGEKDKSQAKAAVPTLGRLALLREEQWRDDYTANSLLRAKFRRKRQELKAIEAKDKALLAKSSLDINLLPETEEDRKLATLLSLAPAMSVDEKMLQTREAVISRPALPSCSGNPTTFVGIHAARQLEKNLTKNSLGILRKSRTICKDKEICISLDNKIQEESLKSCDVKLKRGQHLDSFDVKLEKGRTKLNSNLCDRVSPGDNNCVMKKSSNSVKLVSDEYGFSSSEESL